MQPYNPYAAPEAPILAGQGALASFRMNGKNLVFARSQFLPNACVKCGALPPVPIVRRWQKYAFMPWYGWFLGLFRLLIIKRAKVELPLCVPCDAGYRAALRAMRISLAVTLAGGVLIFVAASEDSALLVETGVGMFLLGVPAIIGVAIVFRAKWLPRAVRIDANDVTLSGVHPQTMAFFIAPQEAVESPAR